MKIEYLGHACFRITSKNGCVVITDPYQGVGYELPIGLKADFVTVSHGHFDHNHISAVECSNIVDGCQAIEQNGIRIEGIQTFHDEKQGTLRGKNFVYKITVDGKTVCHLGDLGEAYTEQLCARIGAVDVLLIPVGGKYTIDAIEAKKFVDGLGARVVIPMHYKPQDGALDIADASKFLSLFQTVNYEWKQGEVDLSNWDWTKESREIIYLERLK